MKSKKKLNLLHFNSNGVRWLECSGGVVIDDSRLGSRVSDAHGLSEAFDVFRKYLGKKGSLSRAEKEKQKFFAHIFQFENAFTSVPKILAEIFGCASIHHFRLVRLSLCSLKNVKQRIFVILKISFRKDRKGFH